MWFGIILLCIGRRNPVGRRGSAHPLGDADRLKSRRRLIYLDEPSIGLHQRDNNRLIGTLKSLRDLGNTVLVVEHDIDTIYAADHIIDIGPEPVCTVAMLSPREQFEDIKAEPDSVTALISVNV